MNDQTKPTISSILNEARTTQLTHKMKLIFTKQKISKPINFKYAIATSAILDAICACSFWGTDSVDYFISLFKAFCPLVDHIKKQKRKGKVFISFVCMRTRGLLMLLFCLTGMLYQILIILYFLISVCLTLLVKYGNQVNTWSIILYSAVKVGLLYKIYFHFCFYPCGTLHFKLQRLPVWQFLYILSSLRTFSF